MASISARQTVSTASIVACPPARVSAMARAMLQKLSPGCTTQSLGVEFGGGGAGGVGGGAGAGGAVVVVVAGAVVVVVGAVVVVVAGAVVVVVGAAVVVVLSDAGAAAAGEEDASCEPPATGCPLPHPVTTVASTPTPTIQRSARVTART